MGGLGREGDRVEVGRMQAALRAWVLRAASGSARGLRAIPPSALLSLVCASAISPLFAAVAGLGAAAIAGSGVLSSVGGGVLSGIITEALDRVRSKGKPDASGPAGLEGEIAGEIGRVLAAGGADAHALRAEIAGVLEEIDAGGTMLRAAVEQGNDRVRGDVIAAIGVLGADFAEMGFLIKDVARAAAEIQKTLDVQGANVRVVIEQNERQSADIRLVREDVAVIALQAGAGVLTGAAGDGGGPRWVRGCPYRGLLPFEETDAEVFYGRERLTAELTVRLAARVTRGGLVVVTGASGAGKSSLLRAGLVPKLAQGRQVPGSEHWPRIAMTPTKDPLTELAARLAALGGADTIAVRDGLAQHPGQADLAVRQAVLADGTRRGSPMSGDSAARLVLVVDQFEQVFTLSPGPGGEAERQAFITALCAAAGNPAGPEQKPPALVVIAVRGDFWDRCAAYPELAGALQEGQFVVGPMTESDLRRAITGPADAAGLRIDPALTDTILADLRAAGGDETAGVLPLLSQAMSLTWDKREGDRLTSHGYGQAGGVSHAVQTSADNVYDALTAGQQTLAREILRRMTVASRDGRLTRRPVTRTDLYTGHPEADHAQVDAVLEAFAAERLVVLDGGTAQISHDVLLSAWPRLRGWLEDDRASWIFHSQLTEDASAWHSNGDDPSFLYRGTQLAALQQADTKWAQEPGRYPAITSIQRDFLHASTRAATRSARQRKAFAALLAVLLIASLAGAGIAVRAAQNANRQSSIRLSGQLAAESEESEATDPVTASLLAAAAWRISQTGQARESMLDALAQPNRGLFTGSTGEQAVAFSPGGKILATGSLHGEAELWDVATHRRLGAPINTGSGGVTSGGVTSVAFSPSGTILATAGREVQLWDVPSHRQLGAPISAGPSGATSVAFSPSGTILATAGREVQLWDVPSHRQLGAPISAGPSGARSVAFSPNGKILAVGGDDGSIRLSNVATHQQIGAPFAVGGSIVYDVAFSPDGQILATAGDDGTARLWDAGTHQQIGGPMTIGVSNSGSVYGAAFSPDGTILATVSQDGKARLWDVATHQQTGSSLTVGVGGYLSAVAFSPRGTTLATVSQDGTVQLWDAGIYRHIGPPLDAGGPLLPGSDGTPNEADSAAFNPDGKILATASSDGTVRLWNAVSHREIGAPVPAVPDSASPVNSVAFSPDGKILATAISNIEGSGDTVRLWDIATRRQIGALRNTGFDNAATTLAFSPDGRILAAGGDDGKVELWEVITHRQVGPAMTAGTGFAAKVRSVNSVAFSPDGKILATASNDGTARLWDVATSREIGSPLIHSLNTIDTAAFSPDGSVLAIGSGDGTVQLWDVATRQQAGSSFTSGDGAVRSEAFASGGQILATGSTDGRAELWDVATHHQIGASLIAGASSLDLVMSVAFSPDGNTLATTNFDGNAQLWDVTLPGNLPSAVCSIAGRSLTRSEWSTYIGSEPFQPVCP
jgi:WD40 repeat protein